MHILLAMPRHGLECRRLWATFHVYVLDFRCVRSLSSPFFYVFPLLAAEVRKLAGELMAFEEGLAADALDTGGAKWPYELRRRWRSLLEATTQPSEVTMKLRAQN